MKKKLILLITIMFLLTGCTESLTDRKGELVTNPETETSVIDNIICKPTDENLQTIYEKNGKSLHDLPECSNINLFKWRGLYDTILVYPIASIFLFFGQLFDNYVLAIIALAIISELIEILSSRSVNKQNEILKKIKPEMEEINERFKDRTDSASQIEKNDALQKLYVDNGVKPMTGCLAIFLQLPLLIAFIEVLYRVPILSNVTVFGINLAMSPFNGFTNGNPSYIILSLLLITLAFIQSIIKVDNSKLQKRDIFMSLFIVFIVSSFAFSLPCGVAIYFLTSYSLGIIAKLISKQKNKKRVN